MTLGHRNLKFYFKIKLKFFVPQNFNLMKGIPFDSLEQYIPLYISSEFASCIYTIESGQSMPKNLDPYSSRIVMVYKKNQNTIDVIAWIYNGEYFEDPWPIFQILKQQKKQDERKRIKREVFSLDFRDGQPTMDMIEQRIKWILGEESSLPQFDHENYCCMMLLLYIGNYHSSFQTIQLEKEKQWFLDGIKDYIEDDDRLSLSQIRARNERDFGKSIKITNPTVEDLQEYHKQYPQEWFPPEFWYSVSFKDLPVSFVKHKILYQGGMVHCHRKELGHYWWRQLTKRLDNLTLNEQTTFILERITDRYKKRFKQDLEGSLEVDIEDMPPCLQRILKDKRFPGDQNRQRLVRSFAKGGVSLKRTEKFLDDLNTKYPHSSGAISLEKRWKFSDHYKKGYPAPKCDELKTLCPFEGRLDQRKMKCHKECFKERHPDKYEDGQARRFWGPADWFKFLKKPEERGVF